jgi:hypothetical protein
MLTQLKKIIIIRFLERLVSGFPETPGMEAVLMTHSLSWGTG